MSVNLGGALPPNTGNLAARRRRGEPKNLPISLRKNLGDWR